MTIATLTAVLTVTFAAPLGAQPAKVGDAENWAAAKAAAEKYGVHSALLIGIRYHENPLRRNDHKALGVKCPTRGRKWWPGGMSGQYDKAADIVTRHARRHGWRSLKSPTRAQVIRLGQAYAEGSTTWGRSVWSIYQRALRGGMVVE